MELIVGDQREYTVIEGGASSYTVVVKGRKTKY